MNSFVISQLEQYSGIKSHTIRMWEQRYNALTPNRSKGNTRYYDNSQLRRLLNIVSLSESGYKVSDLARMQDSEINKILAEKLSGLKDLNNPNEYYISQLIGAGISYDEQYFEKVLSHCMLKFGIDKTYVEIIYPMISRVGLMWANESLPPAQEHFMSNLIRQKLFTAIDALAPPVKNDKWILFLPENEFHEIGLLYANFIIKRAGANVIYLGSNVPVSTLNSAVNDIKPTNFLFFLVHYDSPEECQSYINLLSNKFPGVKLNISGNEKLISQLKLNDNINWIKSSQDLLNLF